MNISILNKSFGTASISQKRIMIAKDVLEKVLSNVFFPAVNDFLSFYIESVPPKSVNLMERMAAKIYMHNNREKIIYEEFEANKINSCSGCAFGAMFLSLALHSKLKMNDMDRVIDRIKMLDLQDSKNKQKTPIVINNDFNLETVFDKDQLKLIEYSFTLGDGLFKVEDDNIKQKAFKFGNRYSNPIQRINAIMRNIIDNDGRFSP